jgi:hypothetical protein
MLDIISSWLYCSRQYQSSLYILGRDRRGRSMIASHPAATPATDSVWLIPGQRQRLITIVGVLQHLHDCS